MVSEAAEIPSADDKTGFPSLEREYRNWVNDFINDLNLARRKKVMGFIQELELDDSSEATVERYIQAIRTLGTDGKPYEDLMREDLIAWIQRLPFARRDGDGRLDDETINLLKRLSRRFLCYCHTGTLNGGETPEILECIRYRQPRKKLPKDVPTKQEIRDMVEVCQSQRNRAMIFVLYESGCRAGEFLSLRIKDVEFDQYGAKLMVKGKTGERRIRLVESVPDLQLWVNMQPHKDDRDAPLWISREGDKKPISKTQLHDFIVQRAKQAGIRKRVYPHLFRHSRATHLANVLTEAQMREFFGWSKSSDVPSIYVHLSGRDVDHTLLEHYDLKMKERGIREETLKPKACPRCRFDNPARSRFCNRCGMALDDKVALQIDEKLKRGDKIQEMFNRWILEHGEELFKEFMRKPEVQCELEKIQK